MHRGAHHFCMVESAGFYSMCDAGEADAINLVPTFTRNKSR